MDQSLDKRFNLNQALFGLLSFALLLRIAIGVFAFNSYDTYWYRQWILDFGNGFFDIYARAEAISLDYPPLFLVLVYPISLLYKIIPADTYQMADMLFLKLIPILFDVACAWLFFVIGKKEQNSVTGFIAAALWALNPSMLFNSSVWGQTDSVMCFILLLAFWLIRRQHSVMGTVVFAASCMIKFQCLFFAPVYVLAVISASNIGFGKSKKEITDGLKLLGKCAVAGIITVAAVFLPFSIASREPTLFPSIYFSSGGKYPYCTLNAFNFFGLLKLNWVEHSIPVLGAMTYAHLGYIMTALGIVLLVLVWFFAPRRCPFAASFFIMQHIFMFMPSMHERYQVAVLPFCLAVWIIHKDAHFNHLSMALTAVTLINQLIVLANAIKGGALPWSNNFPRVMAFFSLINLAIYFWSAVVFIRFSFKQNADNKIKEA